MEDISVKEAWNLVRVTGMMFWSALVVLKCSIELVPMVSLKRSLDRYGRKA